jgi:oxalate decarboxylase/phosphoglucose isomerase-like protein (cupin superfamily)
MLKLVARYFRARDDRGTLEGLVNFGDWREMNLVSSRAGSVRGDHYHRDTREIFIILDGEIRAAAQAVEDGRLVGPVEHLVVAPGDVVLVEPLTNHTFEVVQDARWINALSRRIDPTAPDILRALR